MNPAATLVDLAVTATRLPLSLYERVRGEEVRATWPPVMFVNTVDALLLDAAGTVLGDERLAARAELLRASVERAVEADRLKVEAEQVRARADDELEQRRRRVDRQEQEAARRAAKRQEEQAKQDAQRRRDVARKEREAERKRIAAERKALRAEKQAVTAADEALRLEDAVDDAKERRRAAKRAAS